MISQLINACVVGTASEVSVEVHVAVFAHDILSYFESILDVIWMDLITLSEH